MLLNLNLNNVHSVNEFHKYVLLWQLAFELLFVCKLFYNRFPYLTLL